MLVFKIYFYETAYSAYSVLVFTNSLLAITIFYNSNTFLKMADNDVKDFLTAWDLHQYIDIFEGKFCFIFYIINYLSNIICIEHAWYIYYLHSNELKVKYILVNEK